MTSNKESAASDVDLAQERRTLDGLTQEVARNLALKISAVGLGQEPKFIYARSDSGRWCGHWSVPHAGNSKRYVIELSRAEAIQLAGALLRWAQQDEKVEQLETGV